jgi:hypothetical protein
MKQGEFFVPGSMKTPRAAAVAGIVFAFLMATSMQLIRVSIPANPLAAAAEVGSHLTTISLAVSLLPFAGIAFLWFIAVFRDRLGAHEDRFFATIFLGSGLLFIAMIFVSAAMAGGMITVLGSRQENLLQAGVYALGRAQVNQVINIYALKMAGVFMISTSTVIAATRIIPRWTALLGYALALVVLFTGEMIHWISLVFPSWVLLVSVYILSRSLAEGGCRTEN